MFAPLRSARARALGGGSRDNLQRLFGATNGRLLAPCAAVGAAGTHRRGVKSRAPAKARASAKARAPAKGRVPGGAAGVCAAYCAAGPLAVGEIAGHLASLGDGSLCAGEVAVEAGGRVAHAEVRAGGRRGRAFFFASGAAVFWGVPGAARRGLVRRLGALCGPARAGAAAGAAALDDADHEFEVALAPDAPPAFRNDVITVPGLAEPAAPLLAVSHGLAQSVELALHEAAIDALVARTRALPGELAATGRTGLRRREVKRFIGELIAARYAVSLVSDILDTPEFFWQNPGLEGLYLECAAAVELRQRADVLEARVQVLRDSLDLLNNELSASSSDRVERAILALIAVEVCIELTRLAPMTLG